MKYLKILGLAAVAAMALMAFAGTASADVLCKTAPNGAGECPTTGGNEDYAAGTKFVAESSSAKLTVEGGAVSSITCSSKVALENSETGSNAHPGAIAGKVTDVEWSNCVASNGSNCTASTTTGYTGSISATDDEGNGKVHVTGTARTTVDCSVFGFSFKCVYTLPSTGISLSVLGGNPASIVASSQPLVLAESIFGCGSGAKWDATYKLTGTNTALWVATKNA
jgi:hypothetical protein